MLQQDLIRLSQGHLNLLSICPPRFQQVYLDGLSALPEPEQQESMQWGSQFHLLMQQRELGLPISSLLNTNSELELAFNALLNANPYLQTQNSDVWREAEHSRSINQDNFLLTVIYDLLLAKPDQAIILDWKTYRQPRRAEALRRDWQTKLYLYVLAETSEYCPEEIQMIYWFVKSGKPKSVTLKYDHQQHQNTKQDLSILLNEFSNRLSEYLKLGLKLPHQNNCEQNCPYHQSMILKKFHESNVIDASQSIRDIGEISI